MKTRDKSYSLGDRCISCLRDHAEYGGWTEGDIITPHGIVTVLVQGGKRDDQRRFQPLTRLDFAHKGRHHMRTFYRRFTHRGVAAKAREFSRGIAS